ncbi:NAD-binding protein [Moesziomyces antarcticus]|uniref:2,4-dienoyl-CoA reductase [(3E)-enoyl-CoA-producing] n=1 Tax=Pseudozyma antarctica TaxID=84753 RepID=A0A5C3FFY5_PSEA2|nr:NAD-binding protein [Moesziomyces antarcticus]GAK63196.1 NAD-binding protein [Moesziomyces antarcticus]SPO43322.1 related to SPS19 - peroxisomal 2,4-dienoyl-CoA reductase [Moesziomyces antarcticus]
MTARDPVVLPAADPAKVFRPDIFKGKVLFCTGGGSGICYEMTKTIMSFGANAAILGRKADRLAKASKELSAATGQECIPCPADVREPEQLKEAVRKTVEKFGRIDFVIAGSAANWLAGIEQNSEKGFKTVIDIDLIGSYNTVKATLEQVTKNRGSYIFISATLHYFGLPYQSHPSAAKAGVDALSRVLAVEMGPLGVRSNVIAPGPISGTEGMDRLAPKGMEEAVAEMVPMMRMGAKSDIAAAGVYLFSDAASFVNGTQMVVDGGAWHIQGPMLPYPTTSLDPKSLSDLVTGSRL